MGMTLNSTEDYFKINGGNVSSCGWWLSMNVTFEQAL